MTRETLNAIRETQEKVAQTLANSRKAAEAATNLMQMQQSLLQDSRKINAVARASLDARKRLV